MVKHVNTSRFYMTDVRVCIVCKNHW